MPVISDKDRGQLKTIFQSLEEHVRILMFTQEHECEYCKMTRELLKEITELSDKISLEVHDFVKDANLAKTYNVDKIPAVILIGDRDYGVRFFGIPAGYEFTSLVEDIVDVSRRGPSLPKEVLDEITKIDQPVHIQVLISPTWPYCAQAVRLAHRFAMANDDIRADMVELTEFPHLSVKYDVKGVPKIVINETHSLVGSLPENDFLKEILRAIGK